MLTRPNWQYLLAAAVLGVLQLILGIISPFRSTIVSYIVELLILALGFVSGQHAKLTGGRPGWFASATGALYGLIAGIAPFFVTITIADLTQQLHHQVISHARLQQIVKMDNTPAAHFSGWLLSVVTYGLLTLIIGSIGGFVIKQKQARDRNAV